MGMAFRVLLPLLLVSGVALADEAVILRCRGIADPVARLACYDALVPSVQEEQQFGRDRQTAPALEAIESYIPGPFEGWLPRTRIRLANGQVWQVTDGSSGTYRLVDPKVRVQRGMLGSFFLEIEGQNRSLRVKRVE